MFFFCSPILSGMPVIPRLESLIRCKECGAATPSLTRGIPVLPVRVLCTVCNSKRAYRPSEVFIGRLRRVWRH
jgi:hypothetical protein